MSDLTPRHGYEALGLLWSMKTAFFYPEGGDQLVATIPNLTGPEADAHVTRLAELHGYRVIAVVIPNAKLVQDWLDMNITERTAA